MLKMAPPQLPKLSQTEPRTQSNSTKRHAASKGLAPAILGLAEEILYPKGVRLLETEDLANSNSWEQMHNFSGDMDELEATSISALTSLHSCLNGAAVHGDVRPPNIFVRWATDK